MKRYSIAVACLLALCGSAPAFADGDGCTVAWFESGARTIDVECTGNNQYRCSRVFGVEVVTVEDLKPGGESGIDRRLDSFHRSVRSGVRETDHADASIHSFLSADTHIPKSCVFTEPEQRSSDVVAHRPLDGVSGPPGGFV